MHPPTSSCQVQMGRETAATVSQQKARAALWSVDWPDERKRSPATPNMWTPQGGRSAISPSAVSSLGSELPAKFPSVLLLSGPRVQCWRACFPSPCLPLVGPLSRRPRRSLLSREWLPSRGEAGATPRQSGHRSSTVAPTSASRVSTAQEQKSEDKKKKKKKPRGDRDVNARGRAYRHDTCMGTRQWSVTSVRPGSMGVEVGQTQVGDMAKRGACFQVLAHDSDSLILISAHAAQTSTTECSHLLRSRHHPHCGAYTNAIWSISSPSCPIKPTICQPSGAAKAAQSAVAVPASRVRPAEVTARM